MNDKLNDRSAMTIFILLVLLIATVFFGPFAHSQSIDINAALNNSLKENKDIAQAIESKKTEDESLTPRKDIDHQEVTSDDLEAPRLKD